MFESTGMMWQHYKTPFWIAQVTPVEPAVDTPERAALVSSGPEFLASVIAGVVLAFAFQFLLTNLSVAAGISYLGHSSDSDDDNDHDKSGSLGGTIRKIGAAVGIWTLVTVTIAIFAASFLAVKLSLISSAGLGAIVGLVIWAAFFSLLVWVSSTTVGSLIGSVVNTATSGMQAILGTATAAVGARAVNQQVVSTAEAAAAAVRRELGSGIDPTTIRDTLEDYIGALRPPQLDMQKIRGEFENILNDPELRGIVGTDDLRHIDRQKFVELVSNRTAFSKQDVNRIVDQLDSVWQQVVNQQQNTKDQIAELRELLKSAQPGQIRDELNTRLEAAIAELRSPGRSSQQGNQNQQAPGMMQQAGMLAFNTLMGVVMGRSDLSDFDVEKIVGQLKTARDKALQGANQLGIATDQLGAKGAIPVLTGQAPAVPYSTIQADVENYLLNTYSWQMSRERVDREFREVLYDPQAAPGVVRRQLEQLKRQDFVDLLQQRGVFTQDKINQIADQLEATRKDVLDTVRAAEETEKVEDLRRRVEDYVRYTSKDQLSSEVINNNFKPILEDANADHDQLEKRLALYDRYAFLQMLKLRNDVSDEEADRISADLEHARDRVLIESQALQDRVKSETEALWVQLESYLRNTGKDELNPQGIRQDLQTLLSDPQLGASALQARVSRFDRDTLVQLLSQRQDLSEDQVNHVIDQVQHAWRNVVHTPQAVADKAKQQYNQATGVIKDQYDHTTSAIADYLRNTGRQELNPEGIRRDLTKLLNNPKEGASALQERLSNVDRETLVKLLSQRQDLSEEQVNQIIDQVQDTIRSVIRAPRRLAARTQARVHDFQTTLEDYLRNTGKDELNPEGIKRDLQLLLHDPRTGVESLGDRLSHLDRDTIVKLLAQRPDMTEDEANRVVDQVLSVRDQFVEQVRSIQRRIQDVIDGVFARIRNYLNSLERPELNYDGIRRDVRKLFDDPQAGFDALRDRLGHFNRDTLVAILSSREDISEEDANRLVDQIESARNSVLQRAERLHQETQRRLEEIKYQAKRQAEETRKAAATAAWWLFFTALTSAAASAVAGALAVPGIVD